MWKFFETIDHICDKILLIIKNIFIPVCIILLICNLISTWLGFDLNSFFLIQILDLDGDKNDLVQLLAIYAGLWILLDISMKHLTRQAKTNDEYRDYLIRELEANSAENSNIDDSSESAYINNSEKTESNVNNIITEPRKNDKKDIIALMLKNNDEITDYFRISKNQAKSSFWFSVISCIVGLIALLIGIYGIVILKDITVSVISLISGSISELISGTVFWVHNKSALQLNHYYDALHENEKFLSAVNIADKLSPEKKEEVLIEIIHKQIGSETFKTSNDDKKQ